MTQNLVGLGESVTTPPVGDDDGGRSTEMSNILGSKEMLIKLATHVSALETENKLLKEHKGLLSFCPCDKCYLSINAKIVLFLHIIQHSKTS
jgi:hypothetical protein